MPRAACVPGRSQPSDLYLLIFLTSRVGVDTGRYHCSHLHGGNARWCDWAKAHRIEQNLLSASWARTPRPSLPRIQTQKPTTGLPRPSRLEAGPALPNEAPSAPWGTSDVLLVI